MEALRKVCALQKQFGKTPAELETLVEGFSWALQRFSMVEILDGIRTYIMRKPDIPAPADIANIIDPPPEPMSAAVYVALKRRSMEGELMYGPNKEYIRRFESIERARSEGKESLEEYYRAEKEVKTLKREYGF